MTNQAEKCFLTPANCHDNQHIHDPLVNGNLMLF